MFKQLTRVGIETNLRIFVWELLHLAIFYRYYTRGAKRDPAPYWKSAESLKR